MRNWIRNLYKIGIGVIGIVVILLLVSFSQIESTDNADDKLTIPPLVQLQLNEKLAKFEKTILDKCKKKAIEDAEMFVDSLVTEELNQLAGDTIAFPSKPMRPGLPQKIILNDSTDIDPIF